MIGDHLGRESTEESAIRVKKDEDDSITV